MKPNLLVPIVSRTNYSKLRPIVLNLHASEKVDVTVLLSSGIVPRKLTDGANDIYEDGITILHELDCVLMNDSLESMVKSLGLSIIDHATTLSKYKPDGLLIVGDRYDMLGPVITGLIMNLPMFHIQGGEISGTVDNTVRNIISLCSMRHYTSTLRAYERVRKLVVRDGVYRTGCPAVESILNVPITDKLRVEKFHKHFKHEFNLSPGEPYFLVIAHPDTTNPQDIDMDCLLDAVLSIGQKCVVVYPNIDAYRERISQSIRNHKSRLICIGHAPLEDFVELMAHCTCMIGNSSAGIREAASFKTPVVNVGQRQRGRERNSNTIDVVCNYNSIRDAIYRSLKSSPSGENVYYKKGAINFISDNIINCMLRRRDGV